MKEPLLDTDTISYFFKGDQNVISKVDKYLKHFGFLNISVITYYEVINGLYYKDARKQMERFQKFVDYNNVISMTLESAKISAQITAKMRKNGNFIGHNDVLIAGIALEKEFVVITNNIDHFSRIDNLEIDNWKQKK